MKDCICGKTQGLLRQTTFVTSAGSHWELPSKSTHKAQVRPPTVNQGPPQVGASLRTWVKERLVLAVQGRADCGWLQCRGIGWKGKEDATIALEGLDALVLSGVVFR